jgi:hypothetical protein
MSKKQISIVMQFLAERNTKECDQHRFTDRTHVILDLRRLATTASWACAPVTFDLRAALGFYNFSSVV